jgi:hypothetical protein
MQVYITTSTTTTTTNNNNNNNALIWVTLQSEDTFCSKCEQFGLFREFYTHELGALKTILCLEVCGL